MRPLLTLYSGIRFRSRLEARWAVVFESMKWSWIYEPEGFVHEGQAYLPDFWVDDFDSFVAIKPVCSTKELRKALERDMERQRDMIACGLRHVIIEGSPVQGKYRMHFGQECEHVVLADCRRCAATCYVGESMWGAMTPCCDSDATPVPESSERIQQAFLNAMSERFGERTV